MQYALLAVGRTRTRVGLIHVAPWGAASSRNTTGAVGRADQARVAHVVELAGISIQTPGPGRIGAAADLRLILLREA